MKKYFYLFAVICSMAMFTACSNDDDDEVVKEQTPGEVMPELVGTWNLAPVEYEDDGWGGQTAVGGALKVDWVCKEGTELKIPLGGMELPMDINTTIAPLANAMGSAFMSVLLQNVEFAANGDINCVYGDDDNMNYAMGGTPDEGAELKWHKGDGYAHWKPTEDKNTILVFLDNDKILASEDDAEAKQSIGAILDMFKDGVPVHIRWNAAMTEPFFYVDKAFVEPVLRNLSTMASQIPTDGMDEEDLQTLEMLKGIAGQIPTILDNTTKFEAGLKLVKYVK